MIRESKEVIMDIIKPIIRHALYPYMEVAKGNQIRTRIKELSITDMAPIDLLLKQQDDHLRSLLMHCIEEVPFYKAYYHLKELIHENPREALTKFPVLDKKTFSQHQEEFIAQNANEADYIQNRTGGSTGEPVRFILDRNTVEYYEACRYRGLSWYHITPYDRSIMVWGSPVEIDVLQNKKAQFKEKILKNRIVIPAYSLKEEEIQKHYDQIHSYQPDYIYGYASALALLAQLIKSKNLKITHPIKGIITTSENLFKEQRTIIEEVFHTTCINEYGARDGGIIAYECPQQSLHIAMESLVVETVDIQSNMSTNDSGKILITDLHNFIMPRLRYEVGDLGKIEPSTCTCGRSHLVLTSLDGRIDDMFVTKHGEYVHGHFVNHIARDMNAFETFQVTQTAPETFEILIVPKSTTTDDQIEHFVRLIADKFDTSDITVEKVKEIAKSASGKIRYARRTF
jgi:phenylacetate-CoA ligase